MMNRMSAEERRALKAEVYAGIKKLGCQVDGLEPKLRSTATLIEQYAGEADRISREDAELNKAAYRKGAKCEVRHMKLLSAALPLRCSCLPPFRTEVTILSMLPGVLRSN